MAFLGRIVMTESGWYPFSQTKFPTQKFPYNYLALYGKVSSRIATSFLSEVKKKMI